MDLHWVSEQLISPQPSRRMTGYESDPEGAAWSRITTQAARARAASHLYSQLATQAVIACG
jgi:hypothetical protein